MDVYASQKKYFEKAYTTGEHGWPVEGPSAPVVQFVKQFKKEKPSGRILDIGCGEGRHTALFAQHGYQAVGLDYEPLAIARAKKYLGNGALPGHLKLIIGDVFHLPFPARSFDVLLDYGCFHHIRKGDAETYLKSIVRPLKPAGFFLLSCFSMHFKHHPQEKRTRDWLAHQGHYDRFFKKESFKKIFGGAFEILRIEEERQSLYAFYHVLMQKRP